MKKNLFFFALLYTTSILCAAIESSIIITPNSSNHSQAEPEYLRITTKNRILINFCTRLNKKNTILRIINSNPENNMVTIEIDSLYFKDDLIPSLLEIYPCTKEKEYINLLYDLFSKIDRIYFSKKNYMFLKRLFPTINSPLTNQKSTIGFW